MSFAEIQVRLVVERVSISFVFDEQRGHQLASPMQYHGGEAHLVGACSLLWNHQACYTRAAGLPMLQLMFRDSYHLPVPLRCTMLRFGMGLCVVSKQDFVQETETFFCSYRMRSNLVKSSMLFIECVDAFIFGTCRWYSPCSATPWLHSLLISKMDERSIYVFVVLI